LKAATDINAELVKLANRDGQTLFSVSPINYLGGATFWMIDGLKAVGIAIEAVKRDSAARAYGRAIAAIDTFRHARCKDGLIFLTHDCGAGLSFDSRLVAIKS
jgi:hypothetical protein